MRTATEILEMKNNLEAQNRCVNEGKAERIQQERKRAIIKFVKENLRDIYAKIENAAENGNTNVEVSKTIFNGLINNRSKNIDYTDSMAYAIQELEEIRKPAMEAAKKILERNGFTVDKVKYKDRKKRKYTYFSSVRQFTTTAKTKICFANPQMSRREVKMRKEFATSINPSER